MANYNPAYTKYLMDKYGVAWFKMDEVSGNLIDSKASFIGTNNGSNVVSGFNGNARSFNGTNSHVIFNDPVIPIGKKSIRFKFKYSDIPSVDTAIMDCGGTSAQRGFLFGTNPSGIVFQISRGTSGTFNFRWQTGHYNDNVFHDFLFTYDGTLGMNSIKIYIDNVIIYSGVPLSLEAAPYSNNLTLGRFSSVNSGFGKGILDELEIYNEVIVPVLSKFLISSEDQHYSITNKYKDNAIPAMTSNTSPSGVVDASSFYTTFYPWRAFDRIVDPNGWVTNINVLTGWLSYEFNSPKTISAYSIQAGTTPVGRSPKSWIFEGWNGETWIVLDTKSNQPVFEGSEYRLYTFDNKVAYKKYRITVTANQGAGDFLAIGDLGMYELDKYISSVDDLESSFLKHGMDKEKIIDLNDEFSEKRLLVKNNSQLGSGKVFKQKIDTSKLPIKKASIT